MAPALEFRIGDVCTSLDDAVLHELRDDLEDRGEWHEVVDLAAQVIRRGTSATRQRHVLHRTGDPVAVTRMLLRQTTAT